jgi:hypothetical protein
MTSENQELLRRAERDAIEALHESADTNSIIHLYPDTEAEFAAMCELLSIHHDDSTLGTWANGEVISEHWGVVDTETDRRQWRVRVQNVSDA